MADHGSSIPAITVAMSMRNASRYIRECIDSILSQTFTDFELLIVDDGSTDGSVDIVRSYSDPRIRLICRGHDFTASLNALLDQARGRYIARMDADDIMMPDRLQVEYDYLESHPELAAVCSQAIKIDELGNTIGHIGSGSETLRITPRMMCETNHVCNPSSMMRSGIVGAGLRYEREYEYAEDYRFWSRVVSEIGPVDCLPRELLYYRVSDNQVTSTHWDEMMQATERIKADLIAALVDKANPGYTDPVIPESDRQLSLIIPFLNEGEEVENTVRSFLDHGGRGRVDIIVINDCSYDSYPYMDRLSAIPEVSYFLNRERLGVAASRDKGVALCRTPYFLLLDAHMRAYDDLWTTTIPAILDHNDRQILCSQGRFLKRNATGEVIENKSAPQSFGARLIFTREHLMPGISWVTAERDDESPTEPIQAILGAGYAASCRYWNHLGGLTGLKQFGCDEQLISLKAWIDGGECNLIKNVVLGHIYRDEMPYTVGPSAVMYNNLLISESLFPPKTRCLARAVAYVHDNLKFLETFNELKNYFIESQHPIISLSQEQFNEIACRDRIVNDPEPKLTKAIVDRMDDIARYLMSEDIADPGIFTGMTGRAIWLFIYGRKYNHPEATAYAISTLQNITVSLPTNNMSFATGLPGIGWALLVLSQDGFIDYCDKVAEINSSIRQRIAGLSTDDYSFATGWAGILAYACAAQIYSDTTVAQVLDKKATEILDSTPDVTAAFYAMMWLQSRTDLSKGTTVVIKHSLGDWIKPSNFIASDSRFWNLSLYDGVLATSANILLILDYISIKS